MQGGAIAVDMKGNEFVFEVKKAGRRVKSPEAMVPDEVKSV